MFTEQQLKTAHSKVKSGADFPAYIDEIKGLGLLRYEFLVDNGRTAYYGANDYVVNSGAKYAYLAISPVAFAHQLKQVISVHQQGKTDFITFCKQVAGVGVEKWVIDTTEMTCVYYDLAGKEMVSEPIPQPTKQ